MAKNKNYTTFGAWYHRQPRVIKARLREDFKKRGLGINTISSWMYDYTGTPRVPSTANMKIVEKVTGQDIQTLFPI